jgi:CRISPR-associated endoribonuclease Cas6
MWPTDLSIREPVTLQKTDFLSLEFLRLRLHLEAKTPLCLPPYKGSTFRGAFGMALRRTVCVWPPGACERCLLRNLCAYPFVFDTRTPEGVGIFKKVQEPPHPYVMEPPAEQKTDYAPGDRMTVGLALVGKAIHFLPAFISTFIRMGEYGIGKGFGKYALIGGEVLQPDGDWMPVYDGKRGDFSDDIRPLRVSDLSNGSVGSQATVRFLTPTYIKSDGMPQKELPFSSLARRLLQRFYILSTLYGGGEPDLDFQGLASQAEEVQTIREALRWYAWERYSNRQKQRMLMGGFVGEVTFRGDLAPFQTLLTLGAHLHVGKGSSFGMGQYEIAWGEGASL